MLEVNEYNHVLFTSVIDGKLDLVKNAIEEHGANVNYTPIDSNMLLLACINEHWDVAEYLVKKGATVNEGNDFNLRPLHVIAQKSGPLKLFELIVGRAGLINSQTSAGESVLMSAVKSKREDLVQFLLDDPTLKINQVDKKGSNALHYAAVAGEKDLFYSIWVRGCDILALNNENKTPVDLIADESWRNDLPNIEEKLKIQAPVVEKTEENEEQNNTKEQDIDDGHEKVLVFVTGLSHIERRKPVAEVEIKDNKKTKAKIK